MVRRHHNTSELDEVESLLADSTAGDLRDTNAAIHAWLNVFTRLVHLSDSQRTAIRNELAEHLRERTRDLLLGGRTEAEAVRIAIEELGETAQLARNFEAANRPYTRRWLMYASMLGFGSAVVITSAVVLTPNQTSQPLAAVFQEEELKVSEASRQYTEMRVDLAPDLPLVESMRKAILDAHGNMIVWKDELEAHGIDLNAPVDIELRQAPLHVVLDRAVEMMSRQGTPFAWRAEDNTIEITLKEKLDARDSTLVSYDVADIIQGITKYGRKYDHAVIDITTLLHQMVEPDLWRENGGALASLRVVGGRMFVQAPKRMHTQIEWILEQLRQDGDKPGAKLEPAAKDASTRLRAGDVVTVSIFELYEPNQWSQITRTVDADGSFKLPEIGELDVNGMSRSELEVQIVNALSEKVMKDPKVDVVFELPRSASSPRVFSTLSAPVGEAER